MHTIGRRSLVDESGSEKFLKHIEKLDELNITNVNKRSLKGEFQLLFEFVNKVLIPHTEKCIAFSNVDLFLMESLTKFKKFNLLSIRIEQMHKVMIVKDEKHGLVYGFLFNRVFEHFKLPCTNIKEGSSNRCSLCPHWRIANVLNKKVG